ncbi:class I SAM-dependent methyltransferase [Microbulbifer guangxiensis]|uniref:class I SAM-dependent methyltransferase n=1 Tax=Microbulbifer guangxiensis TaxID=2904249 RepID=UPI001F2B84DA|nr:class I SAM-dependent methyltransferase [Microbulbifer guangxiensis]
MGFYSEHCLPRLLDFACGMGPIEAQRRLVVPAARGRVLEVGMGSGLNLPFYDPDRVELVWGLEPSAGMRARAAKRVAGAGVPVRWLDLPSEQIPLENDSVDTVLLTYTLCTIADWQRALDEMRRVLKPGGLLLFSEHGAAPDAGVRRWQDRLNPFWRRAFGGCNLNRPVPRLLESGGFHLREMESGYLLSPRFAGFNYWGAASIR